MEDNNIEQITNGKKAAEAIKKITNIFKNIDNEVQPNQTEDDALKSIEKSLKEIREFKQGRRQFKTLSESKKLWNKWTKEVKK